MTTATLALKSERARAAGTIGAAVRRGTLPKAALKGLSDEGSVEVDVPDWLITTTKAAGVDLQAAALGDPAEQAKLKQLWTAVQGELTKGGAGKPGGATGGNAIDFDGQIIPLAG